MTPSEAVGVRQFPTDLLTKSELGALRGVVVPIIEPVTAPDGTIVDMPDAPNPTARSTAKIAGNIHLLSLFILGLRTGMEGNARTIRIQNGQGFPAYCWPAKRTQPAEIVMKREAQRKAAQTDEVLESRYQRELASIRLLLATTNCG